MDLDRGVSWIVIAGVVGLVLLALGIGIGVAVVWYEFSDLNDQVRELRHAIVVPSSTVP